MTTATAITLTTAADGSLEVHSPYHPDFPAAARALGGRWRPSRRTWVFDGRDEAVVLGAGVVVVGGAFAPSAGSRQHPALIDSDEAVTLEVRDLPVEALSAARELEWTRAGGSGGAGPDRAALLAERDALLARLAELDALLAADGR